MDKKPIRKQLDHQLPWWIANEGQRWMITVNCETRGINQLCKPELLDVFKQSIEYRNKADIWRCSLFVLMPDHLHMIVSLKPEQTLPRVIGDWKRWLANKHGIKWQSNFHDHRIRNNESLVEKADYLLMNAVRAGLCDDYHHWEYLWVDKYNGEGLVDLLK